MYSNCSPVRCTFSINKNCYTDVMKSMQYIGKILLVLAAAILPALFVYIHSDPIISKLSEVKTSLLKPTPCVKPITYSIGNYDTSFGVKKADFLNDVATAAKVWDDVLGQNLFEYSDVGTVKINLIYDYRQKATSEMQKIDTTIQSQKDKMSALKAQYSSMNAAYTSAKISLQRQVDSFTAEKTAYENQVTYWNANGGAPKDSFAALQNTKNRLDAEAAQLTQATASFNVLTDNLNSVANELNHLAGNVNSNINTYNTVGQSTGPEFDEGEYISNSSGEQIDIYQFTNNNKLIRVLSHELGHALGF